MKKNKSLRYICFLFLVILLSACNLPRQDDGTVGKEDRIFTAAAQTVAAVNTSTALGTPPAGIATATPAVSDTPRPTATDAATPTPTSSEPCNRASFEGDATIPDGSVLPHNSSFTKIWLIKNTGSCPWTSGYTVVFSGRGTAMTSIASFPLLINTEVKPGETARVAVNLNAPGEAGEYEGYWRLRSDQGQEFGTGDNGTGDFFVQIRVAEEYSFARMACSAEWSTGAQTLPCPGQDSDNSGYILLADNPTMEDNQEREGPAILVMPQPAAGGYIVGKFPPVMVPAQSDFRATLSCQPGAAGCFVRFRVTYRIDNGDEQLLGEWNEGYEGGVNVAVKDLNMAAGKATAFYFYVYTTGNPADAKAIWFDPRIVK